MGPEAEGRRSQETLKEVCRFFKSTQICSQMVLICRKASQLAVFLWETVRS